MTARFGYALVNLANGSVVQTWDIVLLPIDFNIPEANISVHCGGVGMTFVDAYKLVERQLDDQGPPTWKQKYAADAVTYDGTQVIVTRTVADLSSDELTAAMPARKASMHDAINALRDQKLCGGFVVPASASASLGGMMLQTATTDDDVNWLTSESSYRDAIAAGQGAAMAAKFRTADNVNVVVSVSEGYAVLRAMASWGASIYDNSWSLKDAVTAAADPAALDAIDITSGWP